MKEEKKLYRSCSNIDIPDTKEIVYSKNILEDKTNCANTIKRFYNEDEEKVKNLNFFDPKIYTSENKDVIRSTSYGLFNIGNPSSDSKIKRNKKLGKIGATNSQALPSIQSRTQLQGKI